MSAPGTARPMASLSSGLLARPGQAKPAMRPQGFSYGNAEDLGWNDMGHGVRQPAPAAAPMVEPVAAPVAPPPVLAERAELVRAVEAPPKAKRTTKSKPSAAPKAAFTLRLDADRHLRLRLASAVAGRSSQHLLIAALDAYLDAQPQVEALARQLPATGTSLPFSGEK